MPVNCSKTHQHALPVAVSYMLCCIQGSGHKLQHGGRIEGRDAQAHPQSSSKHNQQGVVHCVVQQLEQLRSCILQ